MDIALLQSEEPSTGAEGTRAQAPRDSAGLSSACTQTSTTLSPSAISPSTSTSISPGTTTLATLLRHLPRGLRTHSNTAAPGAALGSKAEGSRRERASAAPGRLDCSRIAGPRTVVTGGPAPVEERKDEEENLPEATCSGGRPKSMETICKQLSFASGPQLGFKRKLVELEPMAFNAALPHRPCSMPAPCEPERHDGVVRSPLFSSASPLDRLPLGADIEQGCFSPEARVPFRRLTACPDAPMKLASKRPRARLGTITRQLFAEPEAVRT